MRIIQRVQIGIGLATATAFEALILRPPGRQETDVAGLWAVTFIFGVGFFIFGRMYGAIAQENAQKLAAYLALSEEEKLIAKIEENMDRKKIGRLLDVASLTAARRRMEPHLSSRLADISLGTRTTKTGRVAIVLCSRSLVACRGIVLSRL